MLKKDASSRSSRCLVTINIFFFKALVELSDTLNFYRLHPEACN